MKTFGVALTVVLASVALVANAGEADKGAKKGDTRVFELRTYCVRPF
jgi:hypothetical protein